MSENPIRCIITDDEPLARKGLQRYVERTGFLDLVAVCENALDLTETLKRQSADLLFLDIEMPHLNGIDFLKSLPFSPGVIFTTAYEKFALQGYELNVLDYLLKPIAYERFLKACCKARDLFRIKENRETTYLFIKTEHKLEKLFFGEILFAEAMENYVAIYSGDKKIITHSTLKSVQESLPPKQFVQTHKSYIVNMDQISAIEGNVLHVGPYQVPVSKYLKEAVFEKILNNKLLKK
jgi:DNA-binding LytR/AlgR family response regulator